MDKIEKIRNIRQKALLVCIIAGVIFLMQPTLPRALPIVFFSIAIVLVIWNSIGTFFYGKAAKLLQDKTNASYEKAMPYFDKAIKWGVNENCQIVAGTLMLQHGDMEKGREILEHLSNGNNPKTKDASKVSLSMYWWMKGDLDKAIELSEKALENGCKDKNLYVNLCTYLLEKGDYKEYRKYIKDCNDKSLATPAILDLEAAYFMIQKDWKKAGTYLTSLFEKTSPAYKDPYLHKAMLSLHYGDWEDAVKSLSEIKNMCTESNTSVYTIDEIETLISLIKDEDTRWGMLEVVDNTPEVLIKGEMPVVKKGLKKPETPIMPSFSEEAFDPTTTSISEDGESDDDERDVDTSLNDDDEEWIKKHSN